MGTDDGAREGPFGPLPERLGDALGHRGRLALEYLYRFLVLDLREIAVELAYGEKVRRPKEAYELIRLPGNHLEAVRSPDWHRDHDLLGFLLPYHVDGRQHGASRCDPVINYYHDLAFEPRLGVPPPRAAVFLL